MSDGRRVYVYDVKLSKEDGRGGSGWGVTVVTDSADPRALLRVARIEAEGNGIHNVEEWSLLHEVKLLHTAVLDPEIAA
jgi:hypothetical protein